MDSLLTRLWAKSDPFHPLPCHLIDVGNVALALLEVAPFRSTAPRFAAATGCPLDQAPQWLAYLVSLHDLGKCHRLFQAKGPDELLASLISAGLLSQRLKVPFRHEAVSAHWVLTNFAKRHQWKPSSARTVAAALRAHHGDFNADLLDDETEKQTALWEPQRTQLADLLWETFQPRPWAANFANHSAAGILLSGLLVLSDWIGSNRDLFTITHHGEGLNEYAARSLNEARHAVQRLGFTDATPWTPGQAFRDVWPNIPSPNGLQTCIEAICQTDAPRGLAIIEAPMGEGKTEAALYLATHWMNVTGQSGLYVALPTAATSNQMYGRVRDWLARHDASAADATRLVHGTSWLIDEATPEQPPELHGEQASDQGQALDWFRPRKRTLLAQHGVGTVDQAHLSVLQVRFGFLRLYGLAGKVLIIDEVHAYDAYMTEFLELLLRWCSVLSVPVILLSATLPAERKRSLIQAYAPQAVLADQPDPYPLITLVNREGAVVPRSDFTTTPRPSVTLQKHDYLGDPDQIADLVAERAEREPGCIGVIASTVDSAQQIFSALQARLGRSDIPVLLFHARFPVEKRQALEDAVLERLDKRSLLDPTNPDYRPRPSRLVLVATQVVEQSLDLDFDELFTELAPIDLLLQRMGRLWRHPRKGRPGGPVPILHLFLPRADTDALGPPGSVYDSFILRQTQQVLAATTAITLPADMRPLIRAVYDSPPAAGMPLHAEWSQLEAARLKERQDARQFVIGNPNASAFRLATQDGPQREEADEEAGRSYLAVRTRQGDYTRPVLVLEGTAFDKALASQRPPSRLDLKAIHLRRVSLPAWWFSGVEPDAGFAPVVPAPDWMPGCLVLRMQDGRWPGRIADGAPFTIQNDPLLGLVRTEGKGA